MVKKIKFSSAPNKKMAVNYDDLLEDVSPLKVGKIFPTNAEKPPATLESFRPKKYTCLDYNLSETYLRWQVGDTKIRASKIQADYVLAPPGYFSDKPKYDSSYFSGRPPVWKFLDEVMREKIEKRQVKNKMKFAKYIKEIHANESTENRDMHQLITSFAGPDWFQELSPTQLKTIDRLQECILKDLGRKTIENVKANMAELGIYFRPKNKALKMALQYCCANDVEFLLILYQVSNPKRSCYSVSDRILLSAVVHLTLTETLRECHIRMPSPPRKKSGTCVCLPCKRTKPPKKDYCAIYRPPKVDYESPYLIPYTFKPDPPKHSGMYENTYVQYPQSQYFAYLDDLKEEIRNTESVIEIDVSDIDDPIEQDFFKEMQEAEKLYNKLPHKYWKGLVRPTIKIRCMDFVNRPGAAREIDLPPLCALEDTLPRCTCLDLPESTDSDCCTDFFKCDCNKDTRNKCICREYAKNYLRYSCKRCQILQKESKNNIVGGVVEYEGNAIPVIQGIFKEKECDCLQKFKNQLQAVSTGNKMSCTPEKFTIGGVAYTKSGAAYIINSQFTNREIQDQIAKQKNESKKNVCTCNLPKGGLSEKCFMDDFTKKDDEVEEVKEKESTLMPWETAHCACKKGLKDFLEEQCTCPDCLENTRPQKATYVVSGVTSRINNEGQVENVVNISGVRQERCSCLHDHKEKLKKLEEYRERTKARIQMKSRENKYSIGGVAMSQFGPVYNIQGVTQPITCTCLEDHKKEEEEAKKRMPEIPNTGRIKYGITGVTVKEDKNYYNIGSALPIKICPCENLFHSYEEEHIWCLENYHEYLKKTEEEIKNLEQEMREELEKQKNEEYLEEMNEEEILDAAEDEINEKEQDQPETIPNYTACLCAPPTLGKQEISPCQKKRIKAISVIKRKESPKNKQCCSSRIKDKVDTCSCQASEENKCCSCLKTEEIADPTSDIICNQKLKEEGRCRCQKSVEDNENGGNFKSTGKCTDEIEEEIADICYENIVGDTDNEENIDDVDFYECGVKEEKVIDEKSGTEEGMQHDTNEEFQDTDFKRFFIMKKIPCKKSKQTEILKKLLKSLELDGYPLAKLPNCHELPIFQLWMYLRCGKSWNQEQKRRLNQVTNRYLSHTTRCYPKIKIPKLPICPELLDKFSWNQFEFLRKLTSNLEFVYRRQVKLERINSAREYFPILFDYWFPFWTFRDCYFAYMPTKENDIYVGNFRRNQTRVIKYRDMSCFSYNKQ